MKRVRCVRPEIGGSQFIEMRELRAYLCKLLDVLEEEEQEIVIARDGAPVAVIVGLDKYLEIQQAFREFSDPKYVVSLFESRAEIREGNGVPAEEVFEQKRL